MFCFKFKIHTLSNSCSRDNFLCPWKLLSVVPMHLSYFFFSVKLETYSAATKLMTDDWSNVNNFVSCSSVLVSSTKPNIVLPCKLRIPESKLLALFKLLPIISFHENSHFVVFQSFKNQLFKTTTMAGAGCHIVLIQLHVTRPKVHAIEACIFKCDVNRKNWS